ncbi:hypothetical protein [Bacteroides sp.]|uniref:hypothetical protein n=1 Tax=Bacteroides sp. TaxID=29523 RepID=UPI00262A50DF|nr:hypothetical protein [Bacteroides sp.]MDD3036990.1 hypothetical protein [Bacteroides sp.]
MKIKNWYLYILVIVIVSCNNDNNELNENPFPNFPIGKEINVSLIVSPTLEQDTEPLIRTSFNKSGLYAINVFWKGKGITYYQPYASGLFDNISDINIGLIEGYKYRFDCGFLEQSELPFHRTQDGQILYGLPFSSTLQKGIDGTVTNKLSVSINPLNANECFYQSIYQGSMHIKSDSISSHPTVHYLYGSNELDFPVGSNSYLQTTIQLQRAYYSLQFTTDDLHNGDSIKIQTKDIAPLYLLYSDNGTSKTEAKVVTMTEVAGSFYGTINSKEVVLFSIDYRPADGKWKNLFTNQAIELQRNKKNIIKIKKINDHINDIDFSLNENELTEDNNQEI